MELLKIILEKKLNILILNLLISLLHAERLSQFLIKYFLKIKFFRLLCYFPSLKFIYVVMLEYGK